MHVDYASLQEIVVQSVLLFSRYTHAELSVAHACMHTLQYSLQNVLFYFFQKLKIQDNTYVYMHRTKIPARQSQHVHIGLLFFRMARRS